MDLLSVIASSRRRSTFTGLLDLYPGAAAAYSLRALSAAWVSSAVVRVRRSSDNAELDVTAAQVTDGTLTTWTGANDGFVTTWYDQSGNGRNATQATAANQPQIVASGVVVTDPDNGQNALLFDNAGDELVYSSVSFSHPITEFSVTNVTGPNDEYIYTINGIAHVSWKRAIGGRAALFAGSILQDNSRTISNTTILKYGLFNGAISAVATNGGTEATGGVGAGSPVGDLVIGGGGASDNDYGGYQSELIIYNSNQSANRAGIEANINAAWEVY